MFRRISQQVLEYLHVPHDLPIAPNRQLLLAQAKIKFDAARVVTGTGGADGGRRVNELLRRTSNLTALVCYNDMTAIGALQTLKQAGRKIPGDISIVGFDDIEFAAYVDPPLTTVRQPRDELGRLAMQMLLDILNSIKFPILLCP